MKGDGSLARMQLGQVVASSRNGAAPGFLSGTIITKHVCLPVCAFLGFPDRTERVRRGPAGDDLQFLERAAVLADSSAGETLPCIMRSWFRAVDSHDHP